MKEFENVPNDLQGHGKTSPFSRRKSAKFDITDLITMRKNENP